MTASDVELEGCFVIAKKVQRWAAELCMKHHLFRAAEV